MKTICLYLCVLTFPLALWSQDHATLPNEQLDPVINIIPELIVGVPIGRFRDKVDETSLRGKGVAVFYRLKQAPMDIGLRWDGFSYDHVRRPFAGNVQKTKCKIWNICPVFRLEPATGMSFQPYVEGFFGFNRFFTKTYTYNPTDRFFAVLFNEDEENRFDTYRLVSNWGWALGSGIGAYFVLEKEFYTAIDVHLGFRMSGTGQFLTRKPIAVQEVPIDNYELQQGGMTLVSVKVGLSIFGYR